MKTPQRLDVVPSPQGLATAACAPRFETLEPRLLLSSLLGLDPLHPLITYDSGGTAAYDAHSQLFEVNAQPFLFQLTPVSSIRTVAPPRSLRIGLRIANSGQLLGGVLGPDLVVEGRIDVDGNGSDDYTGVLLTGEILAYGALDSGTSDQFDFRFVATGGALVDAGLFVDRDVAVLLESLHSTFDGDFDGNFGGTAQGRLGAVESGGQGPVPLIDIEKATNGHDADVPPGPILHPGDAVTWHYTVTNLGNTPLGDVVVTDDSGTPADPADDFHPTFLGGDTDGDGLLDLDEAWTYSAALPGGATVGQYENIVEVVGNPVDENGNDLPGLDDVMDQDPSHYFGHEVVPEPATAVLVGLPVLGATLGRRRRS